MTRTKSILGRRSAFLALSFCAAVALGGASRTGLASDITFNGEEAVSAGTGFGSVINLLTVQNSGNSVDPGSEFGSVLWNGSQDVITNDAQNTSTTQTAGSLSSQGINGTNFALLFNVNQNTHASLDLHAYTLRFMDASGATLFDATFTPGGSNASTLGLNDLGQKGTGKAGYLFLVNLTPSDATLFFNTSSNRVGAFITRPNEINNVANDGAENFFIVAANAVTPIPEPSTVALVLSGFVALGFTGLSRLRRKSTAEV